MNERGGTYVTFFYNADMQPEIVGMVGWERKDDDALFDGKFVEHSLLKEWFYKAKLNRTDLTGINLEDTLPFGFYEGSYELEMAFVIPEARGQGYPIMSIPGRINFNVLADYVSRKRSGTVIHESEEQEWQRFIAYKKVYASLTELRKRDLVGSCGVGLMNPHSQSHGMFLKKIESSQAIYTEAKGLDEFSDYCVFTQYDSGEIELKSVEVVSEMLRLYKNRFLELGADYDLALRLVLAKICLTPYPGNKPEDMLDKNRSLINYGLIDGLDIDRDVLPHLSKKVGQEVTHDQLVNSVLLTDSLVLTENLNSILKILRERPNGYANVHPAEVLQRIKREFNYWLGFGDEDYVVYGNSGRSSI